MGKGRPTMLEIIRGYWTQIALIAVVLMGFGFFKSDYAGTKEQASEAHTKVEAVEKQIVNRLNEIQVEQTRQGTKLDYVAKEVETIKGKLP